ncbi:MAG: STAS domain-containing protein [Leptospiraceae bacterium]|nr:STAS domain-containing protein [Leptospiraceae bacterium]
MQINKRQESGTTILEPVGDMGLYNLATLRSELDSLRAAPAPRVVLDMGKVPGIDSMTVGFLVQQTELFAEKNGVLILVNPTLGVQKSLQITGAISQLHCFPSLAEGLEYLNKGQS